MNTLFKTVTDSNSAQSGDEKIISFQAPETIEQTIFIQNLELQMSIGVFDSEKESKQRVVVNVELSVVPSANWKEDDIKNVVSYADVMEEIKLLANQKHIGLVETFAEMIIESCFTHRSVTVASVSVEKPDVIEGSVSVGVQISKARY